MRERPMTKRFKRFAAALTAAILAAGLVETPAGAVHDPNISGESFPASGEFFRVTAVVSYRESLLYSSDGGSTWTATVQQYLAGENNPAQDNDDGPTAGMFLISFRGDFSSDGGSTWTATSQQYFAGEHDPAQDNGDGPAAGMFWRRAQGYFGYFSSDGGSTWTTTVGGYLGRDWKSWHRGEHDPAQDNGDGPDAGTFRHRSTGPEYSIDAGSTWTATKEQYTVGEHDPAQDNGDGPDAGTFRSQDALLVSYGCLFNAVGLSNHDRAETLGRVGSVLTTLNNPIFRPCPLPRPEDEGSNTYTWNVDDGIEPTGDWCVSGRNPADISMICRGEGYTYREARRELGFGLGRP